MIIPTPGTIGDQLADLKIMESRIPHRFQVSASHFYSEEHSI